MAKQEVGDEMAAGEIAGGSYQIAWLFKLNRIGRCFMRPFSSMKEFVRLTRNIS